MSSPAIDGSPTDPARSPSPPAAPPDTLARLIDDAIAHVSAQDREDLVDRLRVERDNVVRPDCTVLVIGEFKKGKSSLVNALLNWRICPVDADVTTAVPTLVRYGEQARAWARHASDDDDAGDLRDLPLSALDEVAPPTVPGDDDTDHPVRMIDVELPRSLLRRGLVLVDTPGVNGGLTSSHAAATLRALSLADAIVFVSDASQEYTATEIEFARRARDLCPNVVCALTKSDMHPAWRKVLELNRRHLAEAGIDAEVLPVAAPLRHWGLRVGSQELQDESGYPALIAVLLDRVVARKDAEVARRAARVVVDALHQVEAPLAAEYAMLSDPERGAQLFAELLETKTRAENLRSGATARWNQTLADRFGDMNSNVDLDLARRLREIRKDGADTITAADPTTLWPDFVPWLHERTNAAMVDHFAQIRSEADRVTSEVAALFDDEAIDISGLTQTVEHPLADLTVATPHFERLSGREVGFVAVRGATTSVVITGMVGTFATFAIPLLTPVAAVLAVTLGRRSVIATREANLKQQRAEALRALQAYLEETELVSRKASRDMLRRANQVLRDHFQSRAEQLLISSARAVEAAAQAVKADRADGPRRLQLVTRELELVRRTLQDAERVLAGDRLLASEPEPA